ncbi:MAG: hypothetical protein MJ227_01540 [Bacilli bacterium]|nr:hypothetical protein [Bacilli bacterium]
MKLISNVKDKFIYIFSAIKPKNYFSFSKYKKILWNIVFFLMLITVVLTVFLQTPIFASHNINKFGDLLWIVVLVFLILFDYRTFINRLIKVVVLSLPFLLYLLIAFSTGLPAFNGSSLTTSIFLSLFMLLLFWTYSTNVNAKQLKFLMFCYLASCLLLAVIVYFSVLRGADISSSVYAYSSKNSTGPILLIGIIFSYFLFNKNGVKYLLIRLIIYLFLFVMICLMKCRTAIIAGIIVFIILFRFQYKSNTAFIILLSSIMVFGILILTVPFLREHILNNILFNGKSNPTYSDLFSGRFEIIAQRIVLVKDNLFLGTCSTYFDCMPLLVFVNYGIIGTICLLPILIIPFYLFRNVLVYHEKKHFISRLSIIFIVMFGFCSLFEGLIPFGPGAETFIFWCVLSINYIDPIVTNNKIVYLTNSISYSGSKKISLKSFTYGLIIFSSATLIIFTSITPVFTSLSSTVYGLLPAQSASIQYAPVEEVNIIGPDVMCVGQKIKYEANVYPLNATDKCVRWDCWGAPDILTIDKTTGVAQAKSPSTALTIVSTSAKITSIYGKKLISIVRPEDYDFGNIEIKLERNTPFLIGNTDQIFYDIDKVPCKNLITFTSSDPEIVHVDSNGKLTYLSSGQANIWMNINNKMQNKSNKLLINVDNHTAQKVVSIDCNLPNTIYENTPYELECLFNEGVSDKGIQLISNHLNFNYVDNKITFLGSGTTNFIIKSCNNQSVFKSIDLNVIPNKLIKFRYSGSTWWQVGHFEKLKIDAVYENGYSRPITDKDIVLTNNDYNFRAWHNKNGLCSDEISAIAIVNGTLKLTFSSKTDRSIVLDLSITTNKFSKEQFNQNARILGGWIFLILYVFVFLISFCYRSSRYFTNKILCMLLFALYVLVFFLIYGFSLPMLIVSCLLLLIYFILSLIVMFKTKKQSICLINDCELNDSINKVRYNERRKIKI